jgi:AcrR family transcriptional regulator
MQQAVQNKGDISANGAAPESRYDTILNASEIVFAHSGYKGATMREIAERASVAQGLIHYHFKTKEELFEAMVARRSGAINGQRARMLDDLLKAHDAPPLESIVEALFRPTLEAGITQAGDGGAFARILVSTANAAGAWEQKLTEDHYDPIARKYIEALVEIEAGLTRENAVWAYMFAIGVGMTMMAKTGRAGRLSDGVCDDGDADVMLAKIVPFICAGIRALAH